MDELSRRLAGRVRLVLTVAVALLVLVAPVAHAGDAPEVTSLTASPAAPVVGERVTFTSTSRAPEGPVVRWEWKLNGASFPGADGPVAVRTFASPGRQKVTLRLHDDEGNRSRTKEVFVDVSANRAPVARFSSDPTSPIAGQELTFTSGSTDPDGRDLKVDWDLHGDDEFDATGPTAKHVYPAGTHEIRLRVTDSGGLWHEVRRSVTVVAPPPPTSPETPPDPTPPGPPSGGTPPPSSPGAGALPVPGAPPAATPGSFDVGAVPSAPIEAVVPALTPALQWLDPFPLVRVVGRTTGRGARMSLVTVRLPAGARVLVSCRGRGCPARVAARISRAASLVRFRQLERFLRAGSVLEFRVTAPGRVGKYSRFVVRSLKAPVRTNRCLMPGSLRAVPCPAR